MLGIYVSGYCLVRYRIGSFVVSMSHQIFRIVFFVLVLLSYIFICLLLMNPELCSLCFSKKSKVFGISIFSIISLCRSFLSIVDLINFQKSHPSLILERQILSSIRFFSQWFPGISFFGLFCPASLLNRGIFSFSVSNIC